MKCALISLLFGVAQGAFHRGADSEQLRAHRVSPDVDKSDKKFFAKGDYTYDKRPVADKYYVFDHPYPAVQDSGDFDQDFVKDENSDGGRWQAQMEYDTLRTKIRQAKAKLGELKEKMESEYEEWMRSKVKDAASSKAASEASKDAAGAKGKAEAARQKVNDLEGSSSSKGTKVGGKIGDAVKKVKDEMEDLEECKKKLAESKKRLKELLKEKEEFEIRSKQAKTEKASRKAKQAEEKKRKLEEKKKAQKDKGEKVTDDDDDDDDEATKKQKEEDDKEEESTFDEEAWKKKLDKEQKDHAEALDNYEKRKMDVKKTEDQLARAAENLKKFRRPPYVDDNGGVYDVPKSHAFTAQVPVAIVLTVFAALTAHL